MSQEAETREFIAGIGTCPVVAHDGTHTVARRPVVDDVHWFYFVFLNLISVS